MNENDLQMQGPQSDMFEATEQHIAIVANQILTLMSKTLGTAQNAYEAAKALEPLTSTFSALHSGMVASRSARSAQADPQQQLELEKMKMQHQHALDIMGQHHEEQVNKAKLQMEQQAHEHKLSLAEQQAQSDQQRAGLEQLAQVLQMHQQAQTHSSAQQQQQEQHDQTLSNTDEMHQIQAEQAANPPTESGSEN